MALSRGFDGMDPVRPEGGEPVPGHLELRPRPGRGIVAVGTLACPSCDAPVSPGGTVAPGDPLSCPFCGTDGAVRDFLSLGAPTRPARVVVRVRVPQS